MGHRSNSQELRVGFISGWNSLSYSIDCKYNFSLFIVLEKYVCDFVNSMVFSKTSRLDPMDLRELTRLRGVKVRKKWFRNKAKLRCIAFKVSGIVIRRYLFDLNKSVFPYRFYGPFHKNWLTGACLTPTHSEVTHFNYVKDLVVSRFLLKKVRFRARFCRFREDTRFIFFYLRKRVLSLRVYNANFKAFRGFSKKSFYSYREFSSIDKLIDDWIFKIQNDSDERSYLDFINKNKRCKFFKKMCIVNKKFSRKVSHKVVDNASLNTSSVFYYTSSYPSYSIFDNFIINSLLLDFIFKRKLFSKTTSFIFWHPLYARTKQRYRVFRVQSCRVLESGGIFSIFLNTAMLDRTVKKLAESGWDSLVNPDFFVLDVKLFVRKRWKLFLKAFENYLSRRFDMPIEIIWRCNSRTLNSSYSLFYNYEKRRLSLVRSWKHKYYVSYNYIVHILNVAFHWRNSNLIGLTVAKELEVTRKHFNVIWFFKALLPGMVGIRLNIRTFYLIISGCLGKRKRTRFDIIDTGDSRFLQLFSMDISYSNCSAKTYRGVFGIKVWLI